MKKQILNITLKFVGFINTILKGIGRSPVRPLILCYHAIDTSGWEFSVTPQEFEEQIKYLKNTRNVVSINELLSKQNNSNQVAITFDDGYESTMINAMPILKRLKLPATFFVIGDNKNVHREELHNNLPLLNITQMKKLKQLGFEIGFHSETHSNFSKASKNELEHEINAGKKSLEEKLGFKLRYFAYPSGSYNTQIKDVVRNAGFEAGFTVDADIFRSNHDFFALPRYCIGKDDTLENFKVLISPLGVRLSRLLFNLYLLKSYLRQLITIFLIKNRSAV